MNKHFQNFITENPNVKLEIIATDEDEGFIVKAVWLDYDCNEQHRRHEFADLNSLYAELKSANFRGSAEILMY